MQINFKLERRIGALSENPSGYTKGITLTKEELKKLYKLIGEEIRQIGGYNE